MCGWRLHWTPFTCARGMPHAACASSMCSPSTPFASFSWGEVGMSPGQLPGRMSLWVCFTCCHIFRRRSKQSPAGQSSARQSRQRLATQAQGTQGTGMVWSIPPLRVGQPAAANAAPGMYANGRVVACLSPALSSCTCEELVRHAWCAGRAKCCRCVCVSNPNVVGDLPGRLAMAQVGGLCRPVPHVGCTLAQSVSTCCADCALTPVIAAGSPCMPVHSFEQCHGAAVCAGY